MEISTVDKCSPFCGYIHASEWTSPELCILKNHKQSKTFQLACVLLPSIDEVISIYMSIII
jgi:hypothetical protein